jgi:hypothetical protein
VGVTTGPTPARSVSWRPGADGAPRLWAFRWECVVAWPDGGAILIACVEELVGVLVGAIEVVVRSFGEDDVGTVPGVDVDEEERNAYHDD